MSLIHLIKNHYKIVSIIGLAKNAGKTVTLNHLIEEADLEGVRLGITSTGRDGEGRDVVTQTEKPLIYVMEDTLIATTGQYITKGDAKIEILATTQLRSPLGPIVIGRVKEEGYVEIAGPQTNKDMKILTDKMLELGSELVLVDGAINRMAAAAPTVTEATILATGAVVSRDMERVIEETLHKLQVFSLPKLQNNTVRHRVKTCIDNQQVGIINGALDVTTLTLKTAINSGKTIASAIQSDTRYVVLPGSLVKGTLEDIVKSNKHYKGVTFVIQDGTKVFIEPKDWLRFMKQGVKVEVYGSIHVVAVTLNPYAPQGYYFNPDTFLKKMRTYIKDVPVLDVMQDEELAIESVS